MWFLAYFLLHLIVYALIRAQFLIWNWASLKSLTSVDIFWALLNGIRFDLSALALTLGLCFLGLIWLSQYPPLRKIWLGCFIAFNAILFLINCVDSELFNFTAKRFSKSSFILVGEGGVSNLILPYLPLAFSTLILLMIYILGAIYLTKRYSYIFNLKNKLIYTLVVLVISVIASRGGLQTKPITYVDAKMFNNSYANNLVLNSTFTLIKSFTKASLQRINYYDREELLSLLNNPNIPFKKTPVESANVVIIILESFSKEYLSLKNPNPTPFLNELIKKSVYFDHSFANGRRSIEGVAAILSGIPALMEEPFISSEFAANQIIGLANILESKKNYHTSFFHSAKRGSMHFDSFTKSVGIDHYYGLEEYPNPEDHDGVWGIYDEPFMKWFCEQKTDFKEPFFSTLFTMTSHQPYNLPEQYKKEFEDHRHPILKTVRYTDHALEQYMKCVSQKSWFKNTIFIITADHTGPELVPNSPFKSRFEVPILFYSPNELILKNLNPHQYAQQIDLLPTLLDILNIEYKNKNYLARSLLRDGPGKLIALYSDSNYELVGDVTNSEKQLKAVKQYFSEGLYDNRLYYPAK